MSNLTDMLKSLEDSFLRKQPIRCNVTLTHLNEILEIDNFLGVSLELYGAEGIGKTKKLYELIKELQSQQYMCLLINSDFSFDAQFSKECGINNDLLYVFDTNSITQIVEILGGLNNCYVCIDSIAGIEFNNVEMQKLFSVIKQKHFGLIYTNQLRWKRKGTSSYGPRLLKFYTDKRLLLTKEGLQVKK